MREARLAAIAAAIRAGAIGHTAHALTQMLDRAIDPGDVARALCSDAEVIEDYPNEGRGASCLVLCGISDRPVHVVVSYPPAPVVITVYWPDSQADEWDEGFRRRVRR